MVNNLGLIVLEWYHYSRLIDLRLMYDLILKWIIQGGEISTDDF